MNYQVQHRVHPDARLRQQLHRIVDIDPVAFFGAVTKKREDDETTFLKVADDIGISKSTFTRLRYAAWDIDPDYRPDLRTYLSLCHWLGRDPADFVVWVGPEEPEPPEEKQ